MTPSMTVSVFKNVEGGISALFLCAHPLFIIAKKGKITMCYAIHSLPYLCMLLSKTQQCESLRCFDRDQQHNANYVVIFCLNHKA